MYTGLAIKGGGIRGIAYAGALQVLEQKGILQGIRRVAGTSAGAIVATLVALKYSSAGIKSIVSQLDFASLEDEWNPLRIPNHYGLYAGDRAQHWIETMIAQQAGPGATFAAFRKQGYLDLRIVAASLNKQAVQIFSADNTPQVIVSEAVRASMSIPFFFRAMQVKGIDDLFVDGGTIWNYPLTIFDERGVSNPETLGLYLTDFGPFTYPPVAFGHLGQYVKSLFSMLLSAQDLDIGEDPEMEKRSLRIDGLGISATDFNITAAQTTALFNSGVNCAEKFLSCQTQP